RVERRPRSTIGKVSVQRILSWHFRDCLRLRWKRSTRPLLDG
ncbi:unnamed protein product, partial [Larinioides sclopetarius]